MTLTVGSLFSGIGGLDLGLERAGMRVVWQCEADEWCSRVLAKHWPGVPNLGDVTAVDWSSVEPVDLICGGYPCQPFSLAGARKGESDDRHLWPYFADAIRDLRPRVALLENVPGHLSLGFGRVLGDLAELGFDCEWDCIPAAAVGAPHLRYRVFIVAYADSVELREPAFSERGGVGAAVVAADGTNGLVADADGAPSHAFTEAGRPRGATSEPGRWSAEPDVGRVAARVSPGLDGGRLDGEPAEGGTGQVLRALRDTDGTQAVQWSVGGLGGVQAAEVLLARLCEQEGPPDALGDVSLEGTQTPRVVVRGVWFHGEAACPSCRRAAKEQRRSEHPNPVHVLPQLLACDCRSTWLDPAGSHAGVRRVDRLRGLGNAVVPQVAEWIGRQLVAHIDARRVAS